MKSNKTQEGIDYDLKKCWKQGLSVGMSSRISNCGYSYASAKFYEWEVEKAKHAELQKLAKEFFIQQSMIPGKRSNFVLCTTDQKVLNAYMAFTGKEYEP